MILRRPASFVLSLLVLLVAISLAGCNTLQSIEILPAAGSVLLTGIGQTAQYTALGAKQIGSATPTVSNITTAVTWSVSNPSVATISSSGVVTATGFGYTQILAESGGVVATSDLTVETSTTLGTGTANLSIYEQGTGAGTVTTSNGAAPFINCGVNGTVCGETFTQGSIVTLTETPAAGSVFGGWSANCSVATANSCTITMTNSASVGATFNP